MFGSLVQAVEEGRNGMRPVIWDLSEWERLRVIQRVLRGSGDRHVTRSNSPAQVIDRIWVIHRQSGLNSGLRVVLRIGFAGAEDYKAPIILQVHHGPPAKPVYKTLLIRRCVTVRGTHDGKQTLVLPITASPRRFDEIPQYHPRRLCSFTIFE